MTAINNIPSASKGIAKLGDAGLLHYIKEIQKFPILTHEQEYNYGMKFKETGDKEAAKALVQSHLRLVVKMATKFKKYGLPTVDLVSEGNLGLIQAVKKFDPTKGFRFATYAMWWIRAHMQEYVLKSWSLVKIGTTIAQKKLFFNLHKVKKKIAGASHSGALAPDQVARIAENLGVSEKEVVEMDSRLQQSDSSLNEIIGDEDEGREAIEYLASSDNSQEIIAIENQENSRQEQMLKAAFATLNEREKDIITKRQIIENPLTLEELSQLYKISRERVRQIEAGAIEKIKKAVKKMQSKS